VIDSHAHLDFPDYDGDRDAVMERARQAGVRYVIVPGVKPEGWKDVIALTQRYDNVYAVLGVHPNYSKDRPDSVWDELKQALKQEKVVGVGETGLDYYRDTSPREAQEAAFRRQIAIAGELNLPLVIHCRDAGDDCIRILREERGEKTRGVAHCFGGDAALAKAFEELGFFFSFAGQLTFKKADEVRSVAAGLPIERLLLETDSPFLAPEPHRGKRNEPAFVVHIADKLAELYGLSRDDVDRVTSFNCYRLFGVGDRPAIGKLCYTVGKTAYLNITNRCSNRCRFCIRQGRGFFLGHHLRLRRDPTQADVLEALGDPTRYDEVVFSGLGEPTMRMDVLKSIARRMKARGVPVRLCTNGQGNMLNKRNICEELAPLIDRVSVTVNAPTAGLYQRLCRPEDGKDTFAMILQFIKEAKGRFESVEMTAIDMPQVDIGECARLAGRLGVRFRARRLREIY